MTQSYISIHILFLTLSSIMFHHKWPDTVPCAIYSRISCQLILKIQAFDFLLKKKKTPDLATLMLKFHVVSYWSIIVITLFLIWKKTLYKIGKRHEYVFHQEELQVPNKNMKRCLTPLAIREMQIKNAMWYLCILIRRDKIFYFFIFCFVGLHLQHMEVPRLGV